MKSIEKSLTNFLKGTAPRVLEEELCSYALKSKEKANEIIDILFRVINEYLDSYDGLKSLDKIRDLLKCVSIVMVTCEDINRGIISRKTQRLDYKLDHLLEANKNKIEDMNNAINEIDKTKSTVSALSDQTIITETKSYDFINFLAESIKNLAYLEYTFSKMPSLVNAKDKEETSLFQNIISKYMNSVREGNDKDVLYYSNLLTLMMTQKDFELNSKDKRKCLETIYTEIDKMSITKKKKKKNILHIDFLNTLVENIKGEEKEVNITELAKKFNISISFEPEIIQQAFQLKTKTGVMTGREVVDSYTITIDKEGAIEIDDALSCEKLDNGNYLLGVHIASILGYFSYDSLIVQEAINRNRSIYLPKKYQSKDDDFNRVIPIFPYMFSARNASLLPGESRLARSYFFEIDKNGNIVNEKFKKTIVCSDIQTTYNEANEILKKGSNNKELEKVIINLQKVTEALDKKYRVTEMYEQIKENADDFLDLPLKSIGAERIINKIMLLTGNRVANFFAVNNYPCMYRVHEVNEENLINLQSMIDNLNRTYGGEEYKKLFQLIGGIYPKGWYATSGSHYGLGLDHYCHCTSGLRRASDIVIEHALEVCYDKEPTKEELIELEKDINKKVDLINAKQSPIDYFVKEYKRTYQRGR